MSLYVNVLNYIPIFYSHTPQDAEKHYKKHAKKVIDGKKGRKYVEKKCDCGSSTSSSYDSEDIEQVVEEGMEFEDKSWINKNKVKKYAGKKYGCICLVEVDENGEEHIIDEAMMV